MGTPGYWNMEVSRAPFIPLEVGGYVLCARWPVPVLVARPTTQLAVMGLGSMGLGLVRGLRFKFHVFTFQTWGKQRRKPRLGKQTIFESSVSLAGELCISCSVSLSLSPHL